MCNSETIASRGVFRSKVVSNRRLCAEHFMLTVYLDRFPQCSAGQFVQVQCCSLERKPGAVPVEWEEGTFPKLTQPELASGESLLRRPFSLAGFRFDENGAELEIIYRTVGVGTSWLSKVEEGSTLSILGPVGNPFPLPDSGKRALLVGGGVGIPPMICLGRALNEAEIDAVAFNGVRTEELLFLAKGSEKIFSDGTPSMCCAEFETSGIPASVSSDDGTVGYHGFVTDMVGRWIENSAVNSSELVVYSCGPEPMMAAAANLCRKRGIECHLSLERRMACGMGTCQSCIIKIADESEAGWNYRLCCKDGPVFDAAKIIWD